MRAWSPTTYFKIGIERGSDPEVLDAALEAFARIDAHGNGAAPLLSLKHLARYSEVPWLYLRQIVARRSLPYFTFEIRKRRGGKRRIFVPESGLLRVQQWIVREILHHANVSRHSAAYARGDSIKKCADKHAGSRWLLRLDIEKFFESIREQGVYRIFESLGYGKLISFELARICTVNAIDATLTENEHYEVIRAYRWNAVSFLPTGAPTSPLLANLFMRHFDDAFGKVALTYNAVYSRYADDLIISTRSKHFSHVSAEKLTKECSALLRSFSLKLNNSKIRFYSPGARKVLLGLNVNDSMPLLTAEFKRRLDTHYFFIEKFGALEHAARRKFTTVGALERHLWGLISYARQIDPSYAGLMEARHNCIQWPGLLAV